MTGNTEREKKRAIARRGMAVFGQAVLSAMAFGWASVMANALIDRWREYDPIFMVYMMAPVLAALAAHELAVRRRSRKRPHAREDSGRKRFAQTLAFSLWVFLSAAIFDAMSRKTMMPASTRAAFSSVAVATITAAICGAVFHAYLRSDAFNERVTNADLRDFRRTLTLLSSIVVVGSVMTFGLVEFIANTLFANRRGYHPVDMLGMIGPMSAIMGVISYLSLKTASSNMYQLIDAIDKIADGKFGTRLATRRGEKKRGITAKFNRMAEELENVQTLREDFINHFSHEFKTPIASINGFARILLTESVTEEERARYLKIIESESERLSALSGNALLMTKLDAQSVIVDAAKFSLDEQLKQCAILLSPQWTEKEIDVNAELESVAVTANEELLRHVWINLLGNAIKYTGKGGVVSIALARDGDFARVSVRDTGRGMTGEELDRAFDKYYQGNGDAPNRGLGLGLAIVKRIADLSGGSVTAESELGKGSTFTVRLPL